MINANIAALFLTALCMSIVVLADVGLQDRVTHRRCWIFLRNAVHSLIWPVRVAYVIVAGKPMWMRVDITMADKAMRWLGWQDPKWVIGDPD